MKLCILKQYFLILVFANSNKLAHKYIYILPAHACASFPIVSYLVYNVSLRTRRKSRAHAYGSEHIFAYTRHISFNEMMMNVFENAILHTYNIHNEYTRVYILNVYKTMNIYTKMCTYRARF